MTHPALIERITRSLAYMLRHQPEQFDLELDEYGFAVLDDVVHALNERLGEPVEEDDVHEAVASGDRVRYEIKGDRVRALYGHSIDVKPGEPAKPPDLLYVGVSSGDADRVGRYGLRAGRRRFLHLALTPEDALETGRRTARDYVVITVHALDAWEEGINFYDRKSLFLSDPVPTQFLQVGDVHSDGHAQADDEHPRDRDSHRHDRGRRGRHPRESGAGRMSSGGGRPPIGAGRASIDRGSQPSWGEPPEDTVAPAAHDTVRPHQGGRDPRRDAARHPDTRPFESDTRERSIVEAQGPRRGPNRGPRTDDHGGGPRYHPSDHPSGGSGEPRHDRPPRHGPDARQPMRRESHSDSRTDSRPHSRPEHRPDQRPQTGDRPRDDRGSRPERGGGVGRRDAPRGFEAADRRERSDESAPRDSRGPQPRTQDRRDAPATPSREEEAKSLDSFGLGLFERERETPRPVRPAPPAPRARPEPERPPVAPKREPDDSGFGAGI